MADLRQQLENEKARAEEQVSLAQSPLYLIDDRWSRTLYGIVDVHIVHHRDIKSDLIIDDRIEQ